MPAVPSHRINTILTKLYEACSRLPPNRLGLITACKAELHLCRGQDSVHKPALEDFLDDISRQATTAGELVQIRTRIEDWQAKAFPGSKAR